MANHPALFTKHAGLGLSPRHCVHPRQYIIALAFRAFVTGTKIPNIVKTTASNRVCITQTDPVR